MDTDQLALITYCGLEVGSMLVLLIIRKIGFLPALAPCGHIVYFADMVVRKCKIIVRYSYRNLRDEVGDYTEEFVSFPDFRNYWRWQAERAKAINGVHVENPRTTNARLSLYFEDDEHNDEIAFANVTEFTDYLKKNVALGKAVQYL